MPRIISSLTAGLVLSPVGGGGPNSPTEKAKHWSDRSLHDASPNKMHEECPKHGGKKEEEVSQLDDTKLSAQHSESSLGFNRSRSGPKIRYLKDNRMQIMNRIFVGGLQKPIDENDLRKLFGEFGEIQEVQIKERGNEKVRGFAFVTFKNVEDAEEAIRQGEGEALSLHDVKLNVQRAYRKSVHNLLPQNKLGGNVPGLQMPGSYPGFPFGFGNNAVPSASSVSSSLTGHPVVPFYSPYGYGYPATVPYYPPPYYSQYAVPDMGMQNRWPMYPMPNVWPYGSPTGSTAPSINVLSPPPANNGPPGSPSHSNRMEFFGGGPNGMSFGSMQSNHAGSGSDGRLSVSPAMSDNFSPGPIGHGNPFTFPSGV
jgi:hypothetical protein